MISDAKIIVNRCGREGCGMVAVLVARRQQPFMIREFAGNTPCENLAGHDMSEWTRATVSRDVLILQSLWTVGRSIHPSLPSDPTAHILADRLGWYIGQAADLVSLPRWLRGHAGVTWPTVILAARVAEAVRDDWHVGHANHVLWGQVHAYLRVWADKID
jgi:hypothetical protein